MPSATGRSGGSNHSAPTGTGLAIATPPGCWWPGRTSAGRVRPSTTPLWTDLTRRAPDEVRTPAATLLAFSSWPGGNGAKAWCALDQIPDGLPYPMAALLATVLQEGVNPRCGSGCGPPASPARPSPHPRPDTDTAPSPATAPADPARPRPADERNTRHGRAHATHPEPRKDPDPPTHRHRPADLRLGERIDLIHDADLDQPLEPKDRRR